MFKLIGCIMILLSSVLLFSRKVLESYFTYKFLSEAEDVTEKMIYESGVNLSYENILKKIKFDKDLFFNKAYKNRYIKSEEYKYVKEFTDNLGKRNSNAEKEYLCYNLSNIKHRKGDYYKNYCENRKIYTMCGFAIGVFIIIIFI